MQAKIQHEASAHSAPPHSSCSCRLCGEQFFTRKAMKTHVKFVHGPKQLSQQAPTAVVRQPQQPLPTAPAARKQHWHPSPFPGAVGQWMRRNDFKGKKSFGYFKCQQCSNQWLSAHAMQHSRQACKSCPTLFVLPCCMWLNTDLKEKGCVREEPDDCAPHRTDLCEACLTGISCVFF